MKLSKTEYHRYQACPKTFWLWRNRCEAIEWPELSEVDRARMREGQMVEDLSHGFVAGHFAGTVSNQITFDTGSLIARADFVHDDGSGSIDIVEVKASTSVKESGGQDHILDAAFQVLVAERCGSKVRSACLVHLNGDYVRSGDLAIDQLFVVQDVTAEVRERLIELEAEIDDAVAYLGLSAIDEVGCECRFKSASNHCEGFAHFNPGIPSDSAHVLPRISPAKLRGWDGDFDLHAISEDDLTPGQKLVHRAFKGGPVIDRPALSAFLAAMQFPLQFYDYETTGPAVPPVDGYRPYQALPVQFSFHRLGADGTLEHFEFLSEKHGDQRALIDELEKLVDPAGSLVSWNKSYEHGCNKRMAQIHADKADFLMGLDAFTVDLEVPFKKHYVDWRFRGSTSIKKVLPVLVPELAYPQDKVHDGTEAVEAWTRMIESENDAERRDLRQQLLEYCGLDTLAMVRIYQVLRDFVAAG